VVFCTAQQLSVCGTRQLILIYTFKSDCESRRFINRSKKVSAVAVFSDAFLAFQFRITSHVTERCLLEKAVDLSIEWVYTATSEQTPAGFHLALTPALLNNPL